MFRNGFDPDIAVKYEIGPFRLDAEAEILFRGDEPIAVSQRAIALLGALVDRVGTTVPKNALIEAAWPGLAIEESNLTVQIAALRRVLSSEPGGERWIETLPRRGYRFIGPLSPIGEKAQASTDKATIEPVPALPLPDKPSIAVLAFENLSGDPEQEYFADGLADEIITGLAKFHRFFVIARNSSFTYKGKAVEVKQVARELGVQYVLEGSVRKAGNRVRVIAQLIDALTGRHVWAERYDRHLEDVFDVQDEVTEAIVSAVAPSFISAEARRVERKPPESFDAWDCALRGNWHLSRHNREDNAKAQSLFERALESDPANVAALNGLAFAHGFSLFFGWAVDPDEARNAAFAAGQRAVAEDPKDAEAHVAFARGCMVVHEVDSAVSACRRALELNPNLAIAEGYLGMMLSWQGEYDEAILHAKKGARLSPHDPVYSWWSVAWMSAAFGAGQYDQAIEWSKRMIELAPGHPTAWRYLAASLAQLDRIEEARIAGDRLLALIPRESLRLVRTVLPPVNPDRMERLIDGLRKAGVPE